MKENKEKTIIRNFELSDDELCILKGMTSFMLDEAEITSGARKIIRSFP